jgi:glucose/arabinose dehydrogenase
MTKLYRAGKALMLMLFFKPFFVNAQVSYQSIITTGLTDPIDIAIPPNASPANGSTRIFIAQQNGTIQLWNGTSLSAFADLSGVIAAGGERGLLSMTFHPNYDGVTNRDFFVYYTRTDGDLTLARYRTAVGDPNSLDPAGGTVLITPIEHSSQTNHNGGDLNFGTDGFLYLSTGDGGGSGDPGENAQNSSSLLGKLLRIDLSASIPITPQVVDIGFRNPFRWSFDKLTGDAWIGDVGQNEWEEISFKPAGSTGLNFGWDCYEGNTSFEPTGCPASGFTFPSFVYTNPDEGRSVVGGYVYRGSEYAFAQGWYIATDYFTGRIFRRSPDGTWYTQTGGQTNVSSFGEAPDGTLYAVSQGSDDLYKVVFTAPLPVVLSHFSAKRNGDVSELAWKTSAEQNTAQFKVEFSTTASNFQTAGVVNASRNPEGSQYSFKHHQAASTLFYRLAMEDDDGSVSYSSILRVSSADKQEIQVYPTLINNNLLNLSLSKQASKMQLINSSGSIVFEKNLNNLSGAITVQLPNLPKGMYLVRVITASEASTSRIVIN